MSYISILLPAFHTHLDQTEDIVYYYLKKENFVKKEFNLQEENDFELILISNDPLEYCVKLRKFALSLKEIEDIITENEVSKIKLEKCYESIKTLTDNIESLNKELKSKENMRTIEHEARKIYEENNRLKETITKQLEYSEIFKSNTERTLLSLREEFSNLVLEIKYLKNTKSSNKNLSNSNLYIEEMDCTEDTNTTNKRVIYNNSVYNQPIPYQNSKILSKIIVNK